MSIPDPTTFGRWLRRVGGKLTPVIDDLIRHLVRVRWHWTGVPGALTLVVDSTVCVRYGLLQAGAEVGYNPKKRGRPSHHPLLAFAQETGALLGVRWRPGSANTASGAGDWITELVDRLREAGVEEVSVRVDKGFFSRVLAERLDALGVSFFIKVPNYRWLRDHRGAWRLDDRAEGIFPDATEVYSAAGELRGFRLLALQGRRRLGPDEDALELGSHRVTTTAHILTT